MVKVYVIQGRTIYFLFSFAWTYALKYRDFPYLNVFKLIYTIKVNDLVPLKYL